ncbi:short transient receptor potential channel 4-like [Ptychodera flava]|uniref:short transient receptor potential channel 4-like n=1 Tax=Ptychodera flava TaxID=63121 RepID=UPI00396A1503
MSKVFRRSTRRRRSSNRSGGSHIMDWDQGSAAKNMERLFLASAEKGDKKAMILALENKAHFNADCVDNDGRSALVIAIQNRNFDIIKLLLEHDIGLGDALLRAVDIQYTAAVQMICENIKKRQLLPDALYCRALNGDLHPDITPVILAAHHNSYDVLKVLLEYGAKIEDPETYTFTTEEFTLQQSVGLIMVYRALVSQAYMSLTAEDPIHRAFMLSNKMRELSERNYEFRSQYEDMAEQSGQFAADLLSHVRDSTEQAVVLNHDPESWASNGKFNEPYKVQRAIRFQQKKFVSHPHCQQRLIERWYHGLPSWRKQSQLNCMVMSILIGICFPILSVFYIIAPGFKLSRLMKIPYVKFVCSTASSMTFLLLLGLQAVDINTNTYDNYTLEDNGTMPVFNTEESDLVKPPSFSEILIVFWVIGYTWQDITDLWRKGPRCIRENVSWKVFDFLTLSLYWAWIALRVSVIIHAYFTHHTESDKPIVAFDGKGALSSETLPPVYNDAGASGFDAIDTLVDDEDLGKPSKTTNYQPYFSPDFDPTGQMDLDYLVDMFQTAARCHDTFEENLTDFLTNRMVLLRNALDELNQYREEKALADDSGQARSRTRRAARRINKQASGSGGASDLSDEERMKNYPRQMMKATDPILVAEALFALAKVFSFLRVTRITVIDMQVGPMQISLGRMMFDIVRFLTIFSFVWFAFSIGLNQLYVYHSYERTLNCELFKGDVESDVCYQPYGTILNSLKTLFWGLFGMTELTTLRIQGTDHWFTENIGHILFAAYNVIAIVVLLNVLIAMMSNTYTRIEEDADMQWKFSRSSLWMSYYDETNTISPPFNVVPTWRSFKYITKNMKNKLNGEKEERKRKKQSIFAKKEKEYRDVIQQLVQRYIFAKRRSADDEEGGDPLLMQLKEDISGFKYDMFEALTDMDGQMKLMKSEIKNIDTNPGHIGSEMFHALHDVVTNAPPSPKPIGPEMFKHWGSIHLIDEVDENALLMEETDDESSEVGSMHSVKID